MRLPRVRFTVQRMMVAVAAAGLALGIVRTYQRVTARRVMVRRHFLLGHVYRGFLDESTYDSTPPSDLAPTEIAGFRSRIAYHDQMRQKWEGATRSPWLPVAPDPPELK